MHHSTAPSSIPAEEIAAGVGAALISSGLLDAVQLAYIRQKQLADKQPLWRLLIQEGLASENTVAHILAQLLGIEFVDVDALPQPDLAILALFNRELCLNGNFMPLRKQEDTLLVALGDGLPQDVAQTVMRRTGMRCTFVQTHFSNLTKFIRNLYYFAKNPPEKLVMRDIERLTDDVDHAHSPSELLDHLLHWAVQERATDIHITSGANTKHILFRIDGVLQPICALPSSMVRLLGYIKLASEMDISEQRRPQDGSFRAVVLDAQLTIRVSTLVTEYGERAVLRLLPESHDVKDLAALGFFEEDVQTIAQAMASPVGLILITGPTGSGKSSTLHAGLRMQHLIERNVLTVEDPLEYRVPAAGQTEVNRRAGYDFGTALRHFLRHDPDVILVGEMRDPETAQAALDASATGHLVLSTLHVTTAFGVVPRLRPMGLMPQIIAENLRMVINQRLVRQVCAACAEAVDFSEAECRWLGVPRGAAGKRGRGCKRCRQTGFYGRLPLYELLVINDALANAIADDVGREAIRALAHQHGFKTITAVSRERVLRGQTTTAEIFRVVGGGLDA